MGLRLVRPAGAAAVDVRLHGGAVWRLRAATSIDVEVARAESARQFAGIMAGSDAVRALAATFGDLFTFGDPLDDPRRLAAMTLLAEVNLALACSQGWSGVYDADGAAIAEPDAGSVALLLSDPVEAAKVRRVLNAGLHAEHDEKNASAASPTGGAGVGTGPAPTVAPPENSAPRA
jgi:hypothetical protein